MTGRLILDKGAVPGWAVLPLRMFLGGSFLVAGLDKLNDPAFLDPSARDYIGNQIARFAPGTPLEGFLEGFALPNAQLFGVMTMGGELCVGVAILLGVLARFSAFMGFMLSLTFFLSATWDVRPFYFGADLPYAAGWLTLLLTGPGPYALDALLRRWLSTVPPADAAPLVPTGIAPRGKLLSRRTFLGAGAAGVVGAVLAGSGVGWGLLHPRRAGAQPPATSAPPAAAGPAVAEAAGATPTAGAASRQLLAAAGALPSGQALNFNLPTGEPGILVNTDGGFAAYSALCTHRGCIVEFAESGLLNCPCHNAQFDPAANGQVVSGPAPLPLPSVPVVVEADGSVYLTG